MEYFGYSFLEVLELCVDEVGLKFTEICLLHLMSTRFYIHGSGKGGIHPQKWVIRQFHHGMDIEYFCQLRSYGMIGSVLSGATIVCGPL